jgi:dolichol-phosphate mannosyltransferase
MTSVDDALWDIPDHDVLELAPTGSRIALVIPVINEGDRIRNQIRAIAHPPRIVDMIIADGGSTDGSLDRDFLEAHGVRSLLTKRGPGRLSAQLRMAYAYCLRQGYGSIITMDGNGKDGVEAIARFAAKLDDGYDYVQGSRYAPGGAAVNTPRDRAFANRVIHAPLLSIAGGKRFTDTTNGFRAYSARFLRDARVSPFRSVFQRYELLFYLTVRAGQLGFRSTEIGVTRAYPAGEPPPSKINGWKARLDVLSQTVAAASGRFAP